MKKILLLILMLSISGLVKAQEEDQQVVYTQVEYYPVYAGCEAADRIDRRQCFEDKVAAHVAENFQFPDIARAQGVEGELEVSFIVEKDGTVSNVQISKGIRDQYQESAKQLKAAQALESEAIRSVQGLEIVKPAIQGNKPVRMKYSFPINARLS